MQALNQVLEQTFTGHGLKTQWDGDWMRAHTSQAKIRPVIAASNEADNAVAVKMNIEVMLPDGRNMVEPFIGIGDNRDTAIADAFRLFQKAALHPLLAGVWSAECRGNVDIDNWRISGARWRASLGKATIRNYDAERRTAPADLLSRIRQAVEREDLGGDFHWFRHSYTDQGNGRRGVEAAKDGVPWAPGEEAVRTIGWPVSDVFWSVHHFLTLQRV